MRYEVSAQVGAQLATVWAVLTDVEKTPEWTSSVTAVRRLDDGPFGVGSRVRLEQPRLPASVWTVTEFRAPRLFTWTSSRGGVTTAAHHALVKVDDGTTIATLTVEQTGMFAPVAGFLLGGLTRRYVDTELAGLTARSEASR